MKKIILILTLIMVLFYAHSNSSSFTLTDYFDGDFCFYSKQKTNNSLDLGFCYLNKTTSPFLTIVGESVVVQNLEVGTALKTLRTKVIKTECLENGTTVIYGYSPLIKNTIKINNKKVNLQIATKNNTSTIGWPIILGSF